MTCDACPHSDKPRATLVDGRQVCTWCEDWRHECEARFILSMPTLSARRRHLYGVRTSVMRSGKWLQVWEYQGIEQKRGLDAVRQLEATMTALWRARKAHQADPANDNAGHSTSAQQG